MPRATPRLYGLLSLLLLAAYAVALLVASRAVGRAFEALEPFPLGGGCGDGGFVARGAALALGLCLGWGVPGLALALTSDPGLRGAPLLGRALGLGAGYVLLTGLGHAALIGHAPGRATLLVLLAVPPALLALRPTPQGTSREGPDLTLAASLACMALLAVVLWPKLQREGMNGDGTEAYELARSLDAHPAPYWDLERWQGPGRFGTPAVNPFLTNSYLVNAEMALLGRGELAARLPLVPVVVLCGVLATGRLARVGAGGLAYAAAVSAVFLLWNSYYVGYEPTFADLAEPAFTDTLMTALWIAGFGEVAAGSAPFGIAFLVLASGILYSAPILATTGLAALALRPGAGRRALGLWLAAGAAVAALALAYGAATGDAGDWLRQVRSEYWHDLVSHGRRTPSLPFFAHFVLMTGGLPLLAAHRWRRLSPPSLALLATGAVYLAIVLVSSYKNLHYLAPLPFVLMAPALEASGVRSRIAATAAVMATLALSWPFDLSVHHETVELGRASFIDGLSYEQAALGGDVVYAAFDRPGRAGRLAVGKHTFVRYALDLGGTGGAIRLGRGPREGWIAVAGDDVEISARDLDAYVRWRLTAPPVPSSRLFPRRSPAAPPSDPRRWMGYTTMADEAGFALVLDGFGVDSTRTGGVLRPILRMRGARARLLVPAPAGATAALETVAARTGVSLGVRVNGAPAPDLALPAGLGRATLSTSSPPWREGWNVLELTAREDGDARIAFLGLDVRGADGGAR